MRRKVACKLVFLHLADDLHHALPQEDLSISLHRKVLLRASKPGDKRKQAQHFECLINILP